MIDPLSLPSLHGEALGKFGFKKVPEDFVVEEVLGWEPSGEGEHCLVWVEKRGLDSNMVTTRLAEALGIRRRLISHCGLKDRQAVTRQWFSIHLPGQPSPEAAAMESEGLKVWRVTRNGRKLRRGVHLGNRFTIRLRAPDFGKEAVARRWAKIEEQGVPNFFGVQRFGREGRNVEKALAMFAGEFVTRDRLLRGLLLSAVRSFLFNQVVGERMVCGGWSEPMDGEVYGFSNNRSLILPENCRGDERQRVAGGELELTAPLWGEGKLLSGGPVAALEREVVGRFPKLVEGLEAVGLRQERRVMRVRPTNGGVRWEDGDLILRFDLPKGTYATGVLRELGWWGSAPAEEEASL
jgi:tRNA pseudouridine13 synthase